MDVKSIDNKYIANSYGRFNVLINSGRRSTVFDENNNSYIDFTSGIGVTSFGIGDKKWKEDIILQLDKIQHTSNLYYTQPSAMLAEAICKKTNMDKVFFSNSGAESNECAIKFARKYSHEKYNTNRSTIITLCNSFHGRTISTLAATGQDVFHHDFEPFTDGFKYCPANNVETLNKLIDDNVCAIMFECIQGEGGVIDINQDFILEIASICNKKDILMIVDEVQTGNGRTGKYFSYEHFGINPDIVTTAKGLGGGLPIGATIFNNKVAKYIVPGSHGSTFGGNPVCCAAALNIINRIDKNFMNEVVKKGEYFRNKINNFNNVKKITGKGLMIGIEFNKDASEIAKLCLEQKLLVLTAHKNVVRLLPALNISYDEINEGLKILEKVVK